MTEEYQICPYTGLRAFTEEESLYFKGREEHIEQATVQLQRNKFLMLTGASGDGKSSLVYAGIIPNARAGFLKSKYTQWCVADFRPERSPFRNLCKTVARQLGISSPHVVEAELQHGFSALVDLYKSSGRYVDSESIAWKQADDNGKARMKREAANLIILVDQFEEFFTNPENYHRGVPSKDSNLVLNLLLETARIALEDDIPIYVVFTMRSDFIGQCAAFRTLPEYIGFSQFFVPRLNRSQLQQVIEEPATLSGNRITRRLTERLIHDIAEGVDQLPILQHALNQVWHVANKGADEMDLLHYAMVGGMSAGELPDEQVAAFNSWFQGLPEKVKDFYREPNLQNVLDTHANKLFESAAERYQSHGGKGLSSDLVKSVTRRTFTCLTKIDEGRAVRNRMTLLEISRILNIDGVDVETLGSILDIFREPGNTFLRPFITEESQKLNQEDVLDITHESLIRNWELLEKWAKEEFNDFNTYLDFTQQLDRWVDSGMSGDFLLSIGPLNYFENWYNKVKPNVWWISRYLPEDIEQEVKLAKAQAILSDSQEFLKRSARRHVATRTIIRYGPRRIAAVLAVVGLLVLSSFGIKEYLEKQNDYMLEKIRDESISLAGNRKVAINEKAMLLCENVRLGLATIPEIAAGIEDPVERINAIISMTDALIVQGRTQPAKQIYQGLAVSDSLLALIPISAQTPRYQEFLRLTNELMVILELGYFFNSTDGIAALVQSNAKRSSEWVMMISSEKNAALKDVKEFNIALENAVNHKAFEAGEIDRLIGIFSPISNARTDFWLTEMYALRNASERGAFHYAYAYNGLFQELAYLYAATGDARKALQCVDTLLKYNDKYFEKNYDFMPDNAFEIAGTFYLYNHKESLAEFVNSYSEKRGKRSTDIYRSILLNCSRGETIGGRTRYLAPQFVYNSILDMADEAELAFFIGKYRAAMKEEIKDQDERNFWLADSYKNQGIRIHYINEIHGSHADQGKVDLLFDSAFYFYRKVSKEYLLKEIAFHNGTVSNPRKFLFQFPDYNSVDRSGEQRSNAGFYLTDRFLEYILDHNLFAEVFPTDEELRYFEDWLAEHRPISIDRNLFSGSLPFTKNALSGLVSTLQQRQKTTKMDFSEIYLLLGNSLASEGKFDSAAMLYARVNRSKLVNITTANGRYGMYQIGLAVSELTAHDKFEAADSLVKGFRKPVNWSSLYGFAAQVALRTNIRTKAVDRLIDSARATMLRVESGTDHPGRFHFPYALAMRMNEGDLEEAEQTIRNIVFKVRVQGVTSRSLAFHGKLHQAYLGIPETISKPEKAGMLWEILYGYSEGSREDRPEWRAYNDSYLWWRRDFITYQNENN